MGTAKAKMTSSHTVTPVCFWTRGSADPAYILDTQIGNKDRRLQFESLPEAVMFVYMVIANHLRFVLTLLEEHGLHPKISGGRSIKIFK